MINEEIAKRIDAHYASSSDPLLLSSIGKTLRVEGLWPVPSETRSLREVIEAVPGYLVVRDDKAPAYAVVVPESKKSIALEAIKTRHDSVFLSNLPRSVVLAFVTPVNEGQKVYLRKVPPFKYEVTSDELSDEFVIVDGQYRLSSIGYVESVRDLEHSARDRISDSIRKWSSAHSISLERFYRSDLKKREVQSRKHSQMELAASPQLRPPRSNALERLQSAQAEELREKLVIPLDIALTLSRLP